MLPEGMLLALNGGHGDVRAPLATHLHQHQEGACRTQTALCSRMNTTYINLPMFLKANLRVLWASEWHPRQSLGDTA